MALAAPLGRKGWRPTPEGSRARGRSRDPPLLRSRTNSKELETYKKEHQNTVVDGWIAHLETSLASLEAKVEEESEDDDLALAAHCRRRGSVWYAELGGAEVEWDPKSKPTSGFWASYDWWASYVKHQIYPPPPDILAKHEPAMTWYVPGSGSP